MQLPVIRVVPDDVSIWLVYAGVRRRHLQTFQRSRSVFLELPGFAATQQTFEDAREVGQRLAMSRAVRRWLLEQRGERPTSQLASYEPEIYDGGTPEARALSAELGNIERMFNDMEVGDLVLCPPIGHYNPFLIGEVTEHWKPQDTLAIEYFGGEEVPIRRVRWLSERVTRRDFPTQIARHLQNQHAISRVDPAFTEDILRLVYQNFAWRAKSKIDVFGNGYTGDDPLQLSDTSFLIKYTLSAVIAYYRGLLDDFQEREPKDAILHYYDRDAVEHFRINFNSPGRFETVFLAKSASSLISTLLSAFTTPVHKTAQEAIDDSALDVKEAIKGRGADIKRDIDLFVASLRDDRVDEVRKGYGLPADAELNLSLDRPRVVDVEPLG